MPTPKKNILKVLKPAHLMAIGEVAATWADVEVTVIKAISIIAEIDFVKTIALISPNNFIAWLDILERVTETSKEHSFRLASFKALRARLKDANTSRNKIVHGYWLLPDADPMIATGLGMPKRGRKSVIAIAYTAAEMRAVAKEIGECDKALFSWLVAPNPARHRNMLAELVQARANRGRKNLGQKDPH